MAEDEDGEDEDIACVHCLSGDASFSFVRGVIPQDPSPLRTSCTAGRWRHVWGALGAGLWHCSILGCRSGGDGGCGGPQAGHKALHTCTSIEISTMTHSVATTQSLHQFLACHSVDTWVLPLYSTGGAPNGRHPHPSNLAYAGTPWPSRLGWDKGNKGGWGGGGADLIWMVEVVVWASSRNTPMTAGTKSPA